MTTTSAQRSAASLRISTYGFPAASSSSTRQAAPFLGDTAVERLPRFVLEEPPVLGHRPVRVVAGVVLRPPLDHVEEQEARSALAGRIPARRSARAEESAKSRGQRTVWNRPGRAAGRPCRFSGHREDRAGDAVQHLFRDRSEQEAVETSRRGSPITTRSAGSVSASFTTCPATLPSRTSSAVSIPAVRAGFANRSRARRADARAWASRAGVTGKGIAAAGGIRGGTTWRSVSRVSARSASAIACSRARSEKSEKSVGQRMRRFGSMVTSATRTRGASACYGCRIPLQGKGRTNPRRIESGEPGPAGKEFPRATRTRKPCASPPHPRAPAHPAHVVHIVQREGERGEA